MPKLSSNAIPAYRLHKPSGCAVGTLCGRDHHLETHGSPESQAEYSRLIGTWIANGRRLLVDASHRLTVNELILARCRHRAASNV